MQWIGAAFFGDDADSERASSLGRLPQWLDVPLDGKGFNPAQAVTEFTGAPSDERVYVSDISPKELALEMLQDPESPSTFAANTGSDEKATKGMLFEWALAKLNAMAEAAEAASTQAPSLEPNPKPCPPPEAWLHPQTLKPVIKPGSTLTTNPWPWP